MYLGTVRIPSSHSSGAFVVYPIGDLHLDQKAFNEARYKRYLEQIIADPAGVAVFVGDAVEGHTPQHKHFNPDAIRRDFLAGMDEYAKLCLDKAEELLKPITKAGRALIVVEGNHDRMLQFTGFSAMVADRCKATYLGGEGFVNVFSGRKDHGYRTVIYCTHGSGGGKRDGTSVNAMRDYMLWAKADIYIAGHCFDEETELLTTEGWRHHSDLKEGDRAITLNRETDLLEPNPIEAVYRYDHFKELVRVKGLTVDLAVTGGHGLWLGKPTKHNGMRWYSSTADDAFGDLVYFKLAADDARTEGLPLSDAQIRVLAWIMAEGCLSNSGGRSCRIAQSDAPDGRLAILERDLTEAGITYGKVMRYRGGETKHGQHRNFDAYRLGLRSVNEWWEWVTKYITPGSKNPTRALAGMSPRQMRVFLETYTIADGSINPTSKTSRQLATKNKTHLDFLQEIAVRSGHRSCVAGGHSGRTFALTINTRRQQQVRPKQWSREPYEGTVWCVTVPNGTLVVRRKGHTVITLNTHKGHTQIVPILGTNETGTDILKRPVALIRTPSFLERGLKGVVTYAGRKGYPTSDERIIAVRVDPKRNKMTTFEVDCD